MKVQKWTVEDWKTKAENTGKRINQAEYVACMMRQAALGSEQKVQSEASANQYGQSRLAEAEYVACMMREAAVGLQGEAESEAIVAETVANEAQQALSHAGAV